MYVFGQSSELKYKLNVLFHLLYWNWIDTKQTIFTMINIIIDKLMIGTVSV